MRETPGGEATVARFELTATCASIWPATGGRASACPPDGPSGFGCLTNTNPIPRGSSRPPSSFHPCHIAMGDLHQRAACTVHRTATQHKGRKRGRESAHDDPAGVNAAAAPRSPPGASSSQVLRQPSRSWRPQHPIFRFGAGSCVLGTIL